MDPNLAFKHSQREPLAPVDGGLRWRRPYHDIVDQCRGRGFTFSIPDAPPEADEASPPEAGAILAPHIVSTPPPEARAGEQYAYAARAHDGIADGFTWNIHEGPPGMTVDRHSGKVAWTPAEGGYVEVILCVRSVYGAEARQRWSIRVRKAARVRTFTPNPRFREALRRKNSRIVSIPLRFVWRASGRQPDACRRQTGPPGARLRVAMPLRV